jgi:hypothetical protein
MSRGPGRVQRAILDLIATPEATASFDCQKNPHEQPGPVGVPLDAVFGAVYDTWCPTRSQRVAVFRAIRILCSRSLIDTYSRRVCHLHPHRVAYHTGYPEPCCGYSHCSTTAVGRPRTDAENEAQNQLVAQAMALLRSAR